MSVSFEISGEDRALLLDIIGRARDLGLIDGMDHWYCGLTMEMDLCATKAQGCPLDFPRLLASSDFDFMHDVTGIAASIDRKSGVLTRGFLPRAARGVH